MGTGAAGWEQDPSLSWLSPNPVPELWVLDRGADKGYIPSRGGVK